MRAFSSRVAYKQTAEWKEEIVYLDPAATEPLKAVLPDGTAVEIQAGEAVLQGDLVVPPSPGGLVIFAHGSGSSRFSERNRSVARVLQRAGLATLLLDLLTRDEEAVDVYTREYRFDIERLARRVVAAVDWAAHDARVAGLAVGCFGASTGAAAALIAAAERPADVRAVISRGGRPDMAGDVLPLVSAPTLLIVGGLDDEVLLLNERARRTIRAPVALEVVPGATHLFEEPGTLATVARLARDWCLRYLVRGDTPGRGLVGEQGRASCSREKDSFNEWTR